MRILSGNGGAFQPDPEGRKGRAGFRSRFMALLRGVDAPIQEEAPGPRRPQCPFYGFVGMAGAMIDNRGNACALARAHMPCAMEREGQTPCWDECARWNNGERRDDVGIFLSRAQAFPDELMRDRANGWQGVSGAEWFRRIMGRAYP
jgi:hypothetical protein